MRHFLTTFILLLMLAPGQLMAHDIAGEEGVAVRTSNYTYEEIGLYDSTVGETKKAFMIRVAEGLLDFTSKRGLEGCGVVQVNAQGNWRVRLTTTGSQIGCVRVSFREEGYSATTEFIHSHPPIYKIVVNEIDARLFRRVVGETISVYAPEYSPGDKNNGGGWLVVPKIRWEKAKLLYMGAASKGLPYTISKLTAVPVSAPTIPGTGAYVMSANGNASTVMTVSVR